MYDKIIDMLCATGKMPVTLIDSVCADAHKQIYDADTRNRETQADRDRILFADCRSAKNDWKSAWFDYETAYADNFSMD